MALAPVFSTFSSVTTTERTPILILLNETPAISLLCTSKFSINVILVSVTV